MKKTLLAIAIVSVILILSIYLYRSQGEGDATVASSNSTVLNSDAHWNVGTRDNVEVSAGELSIDDKTAEETELGLEGASASATPFAELAANGIDGDLYTSWGVVGPEEGAHIEWVIDLGHKKDFFFRMWHHTAEVLTFRWFESDDGVDWMPVWPSVGEALEDPPETLVATSENISARYIKYNPCLTVECGWIEGSAWRVAEFKIYQSSATALHTSSPTQITHNDLYEWETFTPNYTKPENTNIEFRFKASKDSESWTDWTSYQTPASGSPLDISSLVTSREGELAEEDFYKYFQVQTRLTSTDGVSTPTLSDYSVGYHTNKPPDKPVAGTVTIGQ